jgi:hypothetical protein
MVEGLFFACLMQCCSFIQYSLNLPQQIIISFAALILITFFVKTQSNNAFLITFYICKHFGGKLFKKVESVFFAGCCLVKQTGNANINAKSRECLFARNISGVGGTKEII